MFSSSHLSDSKAIFRHQIVDSAASLKHTHKQRLKMENIFTVMFFSFAIKVVVHHIIITIFVAMEPAMSPIFLRLFALHGSLDSYLPC